MLTVGSMFSGLLGGLDIACERVFDAETAWQLDITGANVRRRHWSGALQVEADVATVDPADLVKVDVLCGGFPCQDLSHAGKMAGLDGPQSGLYRHVLRFARVLGPQYVVLENVSGLLPYMPRLVADFQALGYGLTYAVCEAADVGLPHLRRRVFVVGELGAAGRGRVEVDRSRRWSAVESEREWATATATDYKTPAGFVRQNGHPTARIGEQFIQETGKRISADWVECLMGVPQGWTLPTGPSLRDQLDTWRAPRGRYPAGWDRSVPWPGFAWEPARTLPDGPPCPGRPARIRGLGNGVVWQQAEIGIGACLGESVLGQLDLFAAVAR